MFLGCWHYISTICRRKKSSVILNRDRYGDSLHGYSWLVFISYLINNLYPNNIKPDNAQLHNSEIPSFCLLFHCVPPQTLNLKHKNLCTHIKVENKKARSGQLAATPHQVMVNWPSIRLPERKSTDYAPGKYLHGLQSSRIHPFGTKVHNCSWENKSVQFYKHLSSSSLIAESFWKKNKCTWLAGLVFKKSKIMLSLPLSHQKTNHEKRCNQLPQMIGTQVFQMGKYTKPLAC